VPLKRRAFLHAAGLSAAAAALTGCGGTRALPPHASIDFPGLARKLSGPLVTPGQPGYQGAFPDNHI
jgi:hypothetical protein